MKIFRGTLLALLLPVMLHAQATIPVSGTKVRDNTNNPVTGQLVFTVTDSTDTPITYTEQGGSPSTASFVIQVVNGAVQNSGGYPPQIANPATMTPANSLYRMQVQSGATTYYTFPLTSITLSFFSYDGYAVPAGVTATGAGLPHIPCRPQAQYNDTLESAPYPWVCSQFPGDTSVYWTQNPSLNPACQRGNTQAVVSTLTGTNFCIESSQAYVTPGFVWAAPAAGSPAAPIGLVPISTICAAGGCGGGSPGGGLHSFQIKSGTSSFGGTTFLTDSTNSDLLAVRNLTGKNTNGKLNADLYEVSGSDGLYNAVTGPCASGPCLVDIPAASADRAQNIFGEPTTNPFTVEDHRNSSGASDIQYFVNAGAPGVNGMNQPTARWLTCLWNVDGPAAGNFQNCNQRNLIVGGSGINANNTWQINQLQADRMTVQEAGIAQMYGATFTTLAAGDKALQYLYFGFRDATWTGSDEGVKGLGLHMGQIAPPVGTVLSVSGAGNTSITTNLGNTVGQGFMLVNENDVFSTGNIVANSPAGTGGSPLPFITTSDTHATSTWQARLAGSCGAYVVPDAPATSKCSVTGATGTFNPALKVCVGDYQGPETSTITLDTDGTSYDIGMTRVHAAGVLLAQGGPCQNVLVLGSGQPSLAALHSSPNFYTSYWAISAPTSTTITYVVEYKEGQDGNLSLSVPEVAPQVAVRVTRDGRGNASFLANASNQSAYWVWNSYTAPPEAHITLSSCADPSFDETVTSTTADQNGIYFPLAGAAGSTTGCILDVIGLNNYWAVGGVMTTGVPSVTTNGGGYNVNTGELRVMPNDLAWRAGDPVIQPNAYSSTPSISYETINSATPTLSSTNLVKSITIGGGGFSGSAFFDLEGGDPTTAYLGQGPNGYLTGHTLINSDDVLYKAFTMLAPVNVGSVFSIKCRSCATNETDYNLFELAGHVANSIHFAPGSGTISIPGPFLASDLLVPAVNFPAGVFSTSGSQMFQYANLVVFGNGTLFDQSGAAAMGQLFSPNLYVGAQAPVQGGLYPAGQSGTGTSVYCYVATSVTPTGQSLPSLSSCTPATMDAAQNSSTKSIFVKFLATGGTQSMNIYRAAGTTGGGGLGLICSGVTNAAQGCSDTGQTGGAAPPTVDSSGSAYVGGTINLLGLKVNGTSGYTGACASTSTLTVSQGVITGCS